MGTCNPSLDLKVKAFVVETLDKMSFISQEQKNVQNQYYEFFNELAKMYNSIDQIMKEIDFLEYEIYNSNKFIRHGCLLSARLNKKINGLKEIVQKYTKIPFEKYLEENVISSLYDGIVRVAYQTDILIKEKNILNKRIQEVA